MDLLRASLSGVFLGLLFYRLGLPGRGRGGGHAGHGPPPAPRLPRPHPQGPGPRRTACRRVLVGLSFRKELLSPKLLPYALLNALAFLALALLLAFLLAKPLGRPLRPFSSPWPREGSRAWGP